MSNYFETGDPPVVTGDEESSLVSEIVFGTDPTRRNQVEVNGIGRVSTAKNFDVVIANAEKAQPVELQNYFDYEAQNLVPNYTVETLNTVEYEVEIQR